MFIKVNSMGLRGVEPFLVEVEADISKGMPCFDIVGLPDAAIKESRDRVKSSIKNNGYEFPLSRVVINLAPADIRKYGSFYELPILISILKGTKQLECDVEDSIFIGELSLRGDIRPISGILPMVVKAYEMGIKRIFIPEENSLEASFIDGIDIYGVKTIDQVILHLSGAKEVEKVAHNKKFKKDITYPIDFSEVKGQFAARRGLEIAAAGGHNALLIGSPGSGKSMLAKRLPSILPDLTFEEAIECTKIYSISGMIDKDMPIISERPFRSPHHTISPAGLSGGGTTPKPGEVSLAHNGVLFLDELPEFSKISMEILRQPLEDQFITISRVSGSVVYPSSIILVAAMNPCPCGYFGHPTRECRCSSNAVSRYLARVSGPLIDRFDLHIDSTGVEFSDLSSDKKVETSSEIKVRVDKSRDKQIERFSKTKICFNSRISPGQLREFCVLTDDATSILKRAFQNLCLSARAYDKIIKIGRTIADLDNSDDIGKTHILEAIQYRSLDRKYWQKI
ncbi:MAG: YifB family Mg chelatase-like AAA ATPase [Oscillospiraceae bacterium]|nr:YifB family Mg chelatase-like AAA ATPase [Oscillospiraceae bacterium]